MPYRITCRLRALWHKNQTMYFHKSICSSVLLGVTCHRSSGESYKVINRTLLFKSFPLPQRFFKSLVALLCSNAMLKRKVIFQFFQTFHLGKSECLCLKNSQVNPFHYFFSNNLDPYF